MCIKNGSTEFIAHYTIFYFSFFWLLSLFCCFISLDFSGSWRHSTDNKQNTFFFSLSIKWIKQNLFQRVVRYQSFILSLYELIIAKCRSFDWKLDKKFIYFIHKLAFVINMQIWKSIENYILCVFAAIIFDSTVCRE